jgi:hypothetical protein
VWVCLPGFPAARHQALVGVAWKKISLSPRLPDSLFEGGIEIEYRLEGNLNHVTVIHTVM